jgi:hypothetical protein
MGKKTDEKEPRKKLIEKEEKVIQYIYISYKYTTLITSRLLA